MAPQRNAGASAEAELPEYAGHYRLESRLGSGGMGVVHLARSASGMKLAVKVVHAEFARDPEFRGRFRQEVAAARRVSGAFTAPVVDADPETERPWMATLFIAGPTLAEHVKRNGPMDSTQLRRLMAGLAEALRDIHRVGVVHRDLKPSNVLLADDGPKVIDFGISRPTDSELRTETGKLIGTPPFMAPEQFRRPREVGPAADVFALGSVLVHAATGRGPFDSDSPYVVAYQVVHDEPDLTGVPDGLAPLVQRCLAKEPEERPSPDELMRELRAAAAIYDTQAFVPAQRTRTDDRPEPEAEPGTGVETGPEPEAEPERDAEHGADQERGADQEDEADQERGKAPRTVGTADERRARRPGRRAMFGAGALALALVGTLVAVQWSGVEDPAPDNTVSHTTPAGFAPWATAPTAAFGSVHCSHAAGRLLCTRPGRVFALDPDNGRLLWEHHVARTALSGPPVVSGSLVQPSLVQSRGLEALDPASGSPVWRRDVAEYRSIAHAGDTLLLTGTDGTITGVDGASGDTAWSHAVPGHRTPSFASFPGDPLAYAASTSGDSSSTLVTAIDPATGEVAWDARLPGALTPVGTADGSLVLISVDAVYREARAVVRYTPDTRRTRSVPLPVRLAQPHGAVRGGVAYLTGTGGRLVAVDMGALRLRWSLETGITRGSAPVADDRHVYLTAPDGRLLAVDARVGRLVGQTAPRMAAAGDRVAATLPRPVLVGGRVYGSAPDGSVFGVDGSDPEGW
ncbi:PQQ-binding-like beta-propeller repeat protein [Streptomyces sp. NPDC005931]|uniref:serine/threonine-protein kinase n=1 Tax=Streptomyces sp. NPDC005931 TaxID=3364737 RepID=UPI0036C78740